MMYEHGELLFAAKAYSVEWKIVLKMYNTQVLWFELGCFSSLTLSPYLSVGGVVAVDDIFHI